jgi:hypothetical protein
MAAVMADQLDIASMAGSAARCEPDLTSTAALLAAGGDGRIVLDPESGRNRYGCRSIPEPAVLAYGSATASTVSCAGFAAADQLRQCLARAARKEPAAVSYAREVARIRQELVELCGLTDLAGLEVILGASGTDLHAFAAQLVGAERINCPLAITVAESETGSGVSAALQDGAAPGATEVATVAVREPDGRPRPPSGIDADLTALVDASAGSGRSVLLIVTDVSKTGLIAPSPACALALRNRHPRIEIMVDACQFRLTPSTLRAYLEHDVWVALTGSKFVAGPAFSGALTGAGEGGRAPAVAAMDIDARHRHVPRRLAVRLGDPFGASRGRQLRPVAALGGGVDGAACVPLAGRELNIGFSQKLPGGDQPAACDRSGLRGARAPRPRSPAAGHGPCMGLHSHHLSLSAASSPEQRLQPAA